MTSRTNPRVPALSVLVPVYNSATVLPDLVARLAAVLPAVASEFEIVLVNDGSRDQSWLVITGLERQYPWVRGIDLMRDQKRGDARLVATRRHRLQIVGTPTAHLCKPMR